MASKQPSSQANVTARNKRLSSSKQSIDLLSQPSDDQTDDERFSVAEEVNLDQQSDQARHVGQMSFEWGEVEDSESSAVDADEKSSKQKQRKEKREDKLKQSINRAVPPSQ